MTVKTTLTYLFYPQNHKEKRIRKRFATKGEALAFKKYTMQEIEDKPWLGEKVEQRSLLNMVTLWHNHHSISLAHSKYIYRKLPVTVLGMSEIFMMRFIRKMP